LLDRQTGQVSGINTLEGDGGTRSSQNQVGRHRLSTDYAVLGSWVQGRFTAMTNYGSPAPRRCVQTLSWSVSRKMLYQWSNRAFHAWTQLSGEDHRGASRVWLVVRALQTVAVALYSYEESTRSLAWKPSDSRTRAVSRHPNLEGTQGRDLRRK